MFFCYGHGKSRNIQCIRAFVAIFHNLSKWDFLDFISLSKTHVNLLQQVQDSPSPESNHS